MAAVLPPVVVARPARAPAQALVPRLQALLVQVPVKARARRPVVLQELVRALPAVPARRKSRSTTA